MWLDFLVRLPVCCETSQTDQRTLFAIQPHVVTWCCKGQEWVMKVVLLMWLGFARVIAKTMTFWTVGRPTGGNTTGWAHRIFARLKSRVPDILKHSSNPYYDDRTYQERRSHEYSEGRILLLGALQGTGEGNDSYDYGTVPNTVPIDQMWYRVGRSWTVICADESPRQTDHPFTLAMIHVEILIRKWLNRRTRGTHVRTAVVIAKLTFGFAGDFILQSVREKYK